MSLCMQGSVMHGQYVQCNRPLGHHGEHTDKRPDGVEWVWPNGLTERCFGHYPSDEHFADGSIGVLHCQLPKGHAGHHANVVKVRG